MTRTWLGQPTRLDVALASCGLARSRSHAAELIRAGVATVDGNIVSKAGHRVRSGALVNVTTDDHYVSRGAHKLVRALAEFNIEPSERIALDVGASTGGFTQVLLEGGAREVIAVDVGHDQLAPTIRDDPRVHVMEGVNARFLTRAQLEQSTGVSAQPTLIVGDLSFISLTMVLPPLARIASPDAQLVFLIKPQFEVGREGIQEGIVTAPELRAHAIQRVIVAAAKEGLSTQGLIPSPIRGAAGNREYLVHMSRTSGADPTQWEGTVQKLVAAEARAAASESVESEEDA